MWCWRIQWCKYTSSTNNAPYPTMDTHTNRLIIANILLTRQTGISTPKRWKDWTTIKDIVKRSGHKTASLKRYIARFLFMKSIPHHSQHLHMFLTEVSKLYPGPKWNCYFVNNHAYTKLKFVLVFPFWYFFLNCNFIL